MSRDSGRPASLGPRMLLATPVALALTLLGLWLLDHPPQSVSLAGRTAHMGSGVQVILGIGEIAAGQLVFLRFVADACFPGAPRELRLGSQAVLTLVVAGAVGLLGVEVWWR